jgi:hypothetical protein
MQPSGAVQMSSSSTMSVRRWMSCGWAGGVTGVELPGLAVPVAVTLSADRFKMLRSRGVCRPFHVTPASPPCQGVPEKRCWSDVWGRAAGDVASVSRASHGRLTPDMRALGRGRCGLRPPAPPLGGRFRQASQPWGRRDCWRCTSRIGRDRFDSPLSARAGYGGFETGSWAALRSGGLRGGRV